jgi:hypothetical protein
MLTIKDTAKLHHATRAKAERLSNAFEADYPALRLSAAYNEDESQVIGWAIDHQVGEGDMTEVATYGLKELPELLDVLELCDELGVDPEEGFEEDEEGSGGSVVPEEYRARYREVSSNGQTCGDWLAEFLVGQTHGIDGFNVHDFQAIIDANGLDQSKAWAKLPESGQKGWVGRWRMNGRQALERVVAERGHVFGADAARFDVPAGDLAILRRKHEKHLAKLAKAAAKAEAA